MKIINESEFINEVKEGLVFHFVDIQFCCRRGEKASLVAQR